MADLISFSLPEMPKLKDEEDIDVKKALKQIQNYIYLLTEQMKFYLNNIDADNFNDAYAEKVAGVLGKTPQNSQRKPYEAFVKDIKVQIESAKEALSESIKVGKGGYVIINDADDDGIPDEFLICDEPNIENAIKVWRWNANGLGFSNTGYQGNYTIGILPDGRILASGIIGDYIKGIEIEGGIIRGGFIEGAEGNIGGWTFAPDKRMNLEDTSLNEETEDFDNNSTSNEVITEQDGKIYQRRVMNKERDKGCGDYYYTYEFTLKSDTSRDQDKKAIYSNRFEPYTDTTVSPQEKIAINSDTKFVQLNDGSVVKIDPDEFKEEQFFIRRNGEYYTQKGIYIGKINKDKAPGFNNSHTVLEKGVLKLSGLSSSSYGSINLYNSKGTNCGGFDNTGISFNFNHKISEITETSETVNSVLSSAVTGKAKCLRIGDKSYVSIGYDDFPTVGGQTEKGYIRIGGQYISNFESNGGNYLVIGSRGDDSDSRIVLKSGYFNNSSTVPLNINAYGTLSASSSSKRYKENISTNISEELNPEKLYELDVKQFTYKKDYEDMAPVNGLQIGLIAEELAKIYPNAVVYNKDGTVESWHERILIPAMLKLIQEQHKEIEKLKENFEKIKGE